ncbi:MAG: caspase family protein [Candidatus Aminicenantes bacterium]|nr:caspase family protein [Candidatus Aminicenantes bacterium]
MKRGLISSILFLLGAILPAPAQDKEFRFDAGARQARDVSLYRSSYALVIGISNYTAGWPKLPGVLRDIVDVERALKKQGFEVTVVRDVGQDRIKGAIEDFIGRHGGEPENRLLFYFAGHGHTLRTGYGGELGFIVPSDAPNPDVDKAGFRAKAISMLLFENYAVSIDSKHVLFVFDSCFAGSIFAASRSASVAISEKTAAPVRQFITSGSADEKVPDESIFKGQFIAGIEGEADMNRDGYVTGDELGIFLATNVVNYSKGAQHPKYGKLMNAKLDKGDFVFILPKGVIQPVSKTEADVASRIELEFWKSTKESDRAEAYAGYLAKYPGGVFTALAKQRLDELAKAEAAEKAGNPAAENREEAVPAVRLIQLPGAMIREYNDRIGRFSVSGVPADLKAGGQITLVYAVARDGRVSVESMNDAALDVVPEDKKQAVKDGIIAAAREIVLPPPRDKEGNRVTVVHWPVSYQVGRYQDRLVFNIVAF